MTSTPGTHEMKSMVVTDEKLRELLARVKAARGPDRELDRDIASFFGDYVKCEPRNRTWRSAPSRKGPWRTLPYVTASIDAALALTDRLLPFGPAVGHEMQGSLARDGQECFTFRIRKYSEEEGEPPTIHWATSYHSYSLAILAATLSALITQEDGNAQS